MKENLLKLSKVFEPILKRCIRFCPFHSLTLCFISIPFSLFTFCKCLLLVTKFIFTYSLSFGLCACSSPSVSSFSNGGLANFSSFNLIALTSDSTFNSLLSDFPNNSSHRRLRFDTICTRHVGHSLLPASIDFMYIMARWQHSGMI